MNLLFPDGTMGEDFNTGGGSKPDATEDDLIQALAALERGEIEYVGLAEPDSNVFMQVAGDAASGYILEYNEGRDDTMLRAQGALSGGLITDAMTAFLNHDNSWRTLFRWERFTF